MSSSSAEALGLQEERVPLLAGRLLHPQKERVIVCVPAHEAFMNLRCDDGVSVAHQTVGDLGQVEDDRDERVDVATEEGAVHKRASDADLPVGVHLERPLIGHITGDARVVNESVSKTGWVVERSHGE